MVVVSNYPPLQLPEVDIFTFLFARTNLPFTPDKVIYQDADHLDRQYTFKQVHELSISFGKRLIQEFGLKKGERVAIVTPNDIDYPPVVFGILWAGGVVSPANPAYTPDELAYQLKDSGSRLIVAHFSALETVTKACAKAGVSDANILLLGHSPSHGVGSKHWRIAKAGPNNNGAVARPQAFDAKNDVAFLVYSSGTTGRPKGVMITHYNMTSNVRQVSACESGKFSSTGTKHLRGIPDAPPQGDKILACLPYFHIYGLTSLVLAPAHNGIHTVVLAKFEIEKFCRLIQDLKITFVFIVPPMAVLLAKHSSIPTYDLSSIRMMNSGAAPLTKELQEAVFKRTNIRLKQGYGLSETSPTTHEQRWEDWNIKIGTIGRLQPNMEAKFCEIGAEDQTSDEPVIELKAGQVGELYMKGPNVFKGYWNNPTATAACLSKDGWFRTGDIGYVDEDGDFFITDRVKELIKYKGFQVPPAELEGYLLDHELIDDVVVVGVNSKVLETEVPRAYVVRRGGMAAVQPGDERKIIDWLAGKVTNHKKLRGGLKFVEAVPKSPSGKLLRRLIRDKAREEFAAIEEKQTKAKL